MIDGEVLLWPALGFLALSALVIAAWLAHAAWASASERRFARRRRAVLVALAETLQGGDPTEAKAALARLRLERRISVLVEMAFTVAGEQRHRLDELALATDVMSNADRWASSRRWGRRLRAARLLALFGGDREPAGEALLRDPHPDVRAQAAEWAGQHPSPDRIERLAEMLADPSPRCRFYAREALIAGGSATLETLRTQLGNGSAAGNGARGALDVATALATPEFVVAALRSMRSPDPAVRARGATLAGAAGGPEAPRALYLLLTDPSAQVRAAAADGLGRLGHWPAASGVANLLAEPAWSTRRAAALALGRMGPTGELLLQRAARTAGPAADTAKHALGLASAPGDDVSEPAVAGVAA